MGHTLIEMAMVLVASEAETQLPSLALKDPSAGSKTQTMAKYDPLAAYLVKRRQPVIELTFRDIERMVGGILPKAALKPEWWSSPVSVEHAPQKLAWDSAGYTAEVSIKHERVRFARVRQPA